MPRLIHVSIHVGHTHGRTRAVSRQATKTPGEWSQVPSSIVDGHTLCSSAHGLAHIVCARSAIPCLCEHTRGHLQEGTRTRCGNGQRYRAHISPHSSARTNVLSLFSQRAHALTAPPATNSSARIRAPVGPSRLPSSLRPTHCSRFTLHSQVRTSASMASHASHAAEKTMAPEMQLHADMMMMCVL